MSTATVESILREILSHTQATGSARDARLRQALSVAATAVTAGQDPLAAISEMYEARQLEH